MSKLTGFIKSKHWRQTSEGKKKVSFWTRAETVEFNDGSTLDNIMDTKADLIDGKISKEQIPDDIVADTPVATIATAGKVKPDGTTITVDDDGTIHGAKMAKNISIDNIDGMNATTVQAGLEELNNTKSNTTHTHDDRYYTETEVDNLLDGKSDTGHTHDGRYYTESEVNNLLNGKAPSSHTHTKSQITDFPSSLPANGGSADYANKVWTQSHNGSWYINSNWDGTYFQTDCKEISSGSTLPINVARANNAGNANGVIPEWSGYIAWADTGWIAAWNNDGTKIKALDKNSFAPSSHTHNYLPLSGGSLTGHVSLKETTNILLRPGNLNYTSGIGYDTSGNECIALWAKNSVTRLRWYAGKDMSTMSTGTMMGITPDFEISKASGTAKGYIGGTEISVSGHTHDDRYYTEVEVNSLLDNKAPYSHDHSGNTLYPNGLQVTDGWLDWLKNGSVAFHIWCDGGQTYMRNAAGGAIYLRADGNIGIKNSGDTAWTAVFASGFVQQSSRLVKENINPIDEKEAEKLLLLNPVSFDYKENFGGNKGLFGLIAEETLDIIPSCVLVPDDYSEENFDEDKGINQPVLAIDYSKLVPHLIKMIQIHEKRIAELESKINK